MFNHWKFENREILKKKITHKSVNCFLMDYLGGGLLYIILCHLQIVTVLLLRFQFECLLFIFL